MEITIIEDRPNPLLKRHEYHFEVAHATAATPSRDAVRGELSKLVKAPKDRVIIERMAARYGTATTRGDALVYETADAAKSITREHILIRNGLKEKEMKGPAAPADSAVAPTESPKVEAPPAPKETHKPEHKDEEKAEHKADEKGDSPKGEHRAHEKGESHKGESKAEEKPESHKSEHKAKATKAEKDPAAAKEE